MSSSSERTFSLRPVHRRRHSGCCGQAHLARLLGEHLDEGVMKGTHDDDAVHRDADLAHVGEGATRRRCRRFLIVGVIQNHKRNCPPSSRERRFSVSEAARTMDFPAAVEAVAVIMRTSECAANAAPASGPDPGRSFSTPSGKPASAKHCTTRAMASGVSGGGLTTMVQPAATPAQPTTLDVDRVVPRCNSADHADGRRDNKIAHVGPTDARWNRRSCVLPRRSSGRHRRRSESP